MMDTQHDHNASGSARWHCGYWGPLRQFRMCGAIGQERRGHEVCLINRCLAHLAGPIRANAKALEHSINVVEGAFNLGNGLVIEL